MGYHTKEHAAGPGGIAVAPSLGPALQGVDAPARARRVDRRVVGLSGAAIAVAIAAALAAEVLTRLIGLITNLAFYGRASTHFTAPAGNALGPWVIVVPIVGALIVGVMAKHGSAAIRGHGIPEVMERVLYGESRIPPRLMFLKPISAAIAIGTGGPFGAEGPIIATGGALGSVLGQVLKITANERKTLLAAGAAAGMAATFGSPVSAVLLAVELLLFEYRARSVIPVALAAAAATAVRLALSGSAPVFAMPALASPGGAALAAYTLLGAAVGLAAVGITRAVYAVEDAFERLPVHWMWWPALGAVAVGVIGWIEPRTLGVGYVNIDDLLSGRLALTAIALLVVLKFVSWVIYLGSGTSGGTLAPLFTFGGGIGAAAGVVAAAALPGLGIDPHAAALVGMAAMFAGASHALLASIVFAFETTRQPMGLLPLLAGCSAAYLVSLLSMRNSIMTEKLSRRGVDIHPDYETDFLHGVRVADVLSEEVVTLAADQTVDELRAWLQEPGRAASHQGFPVVDAEGRLTGVVTRRDLLDPAAAPDAPLGSLLKRKPVVVYPGSTLREAADQMVHHAVGRLPVVDPDDLGRVVGIVSRSDLLSAHLPRLHAAKRRTVTLRGLRREPQEV